MTGEQRTALKSIASYLASGADELTLREPSAEIVQRVNAIIGREMTTEEYGTFVVHYRKYVVQEALGACSA